MSDREVVRASQNGTVESVARDSSRVRPRVPAAPAASSQVHSVRVVLRTGRTAVTGPPPWVQVHQPYAARAMKTICRPASAYRPDWVNSRTKKRLLAMPMGQLARCWRATSQTHSAPLPNPSTSVQLTGVSRTVTRGCCRGSRMSARLTPASLIVTLTIKAEGGQEKARGRFLFENRRQDSAAGLGTDGEGRSLQ